MKRVLFVFALLAMLGISGPAQAAYLIDFNMDAVHPASASVAFGGGVGPLFGANIGVVTVAGAGGGVNSGVSLAITGGVLNFTTGNLVATDANNWYFGGGGTITITGGVPGLGIPDSTALLTGTFTSAQVTSAGTSFKVTIASFSDIKDPRLIRFFDFPVLPNYDGSMNLSFNASGLPPGAFRSSSVLSGDIVNTVPEPGSMLLLATGLFGLAGAVRRRLKK